MDLSFTPWELACRDGVRGFLATGLPVEIAAKVKGGRRLTRDDHVRWQTALSKRGWLGVNWPTEYGGTGWLPVQRHIFEEECAAAGAPRLVPFGVNMVAPVIMKFGTAEQDRKSTRLNSSH